MHNWKSGVRGTKGTGRVYNTQLRLSLALAKLLKVKPEELAKAMHTKELKAYAEKLHKALGDELNKEYSKAVRALTK